MKTSTLLLAGLAAVVDASPFRLPPIVIGTYTFDLYPPNTKTPSPIKSSVKPTSTAKVTSQSKAPSSNIGKSTTPIGSKSASAVLPASSASRSTLVTSRAPSGSSAVASSRTCASSRATGVLSSSSKATSRSTAKSVSGTAASSRPAGTTGRPSGCVITSFTTTVTTSIPFVTLTTYPNIVGFFNGDDFVPRAPSPAVVYITNDYTTRIDTTLTLTATSVPPQFVGFTTTITSFPPAGFRPVQDTLPSAGYDGLRGDPPRVKKNKRQATCGTVTVVETSTATANTRVAFITNTRKIKPLVFPQEDYTLFELPSTTPYTITKIVGTPSTIYPGTTTVTTTITAPTATSTYYAACQANNYADYIQQANGTQSPINFVTYGRQVDFNFDIAPSALNITTAYECCAYALQNQASVWILFEDQFCVAQYPVGYPARTCLGQDNKDSGFEAEYATLTKRVVGNGYCGSLNASFYGTLQGT